MPRLLHWLTSRHQPPATDPATDRVVYPLTAASQPQLDKLGKSEVDRNQLALGWIGYHDALYACQTWHYSKTIPAGKTVKVGVFEQGRFIGVVIFSRGSNPRIGLPYGLDQTEACELTRVALDAHKSPVTKIISAAIALVKTENPGLRLVISYAAIEEGHHGGIYQAGNWIYEGSIASYKVKIGNELVHGRSMSMRIKGLGMTATEYAKSLGLDALPRIPLQRGGRGNSDQWLRWIDL